MQRTKLGDHDQYHVDEDRQVGVDEDTRCQGWEWGRHDYQELISNTNVSTDEATHKLEIP